MNKFGADEQMLMSSQEAEDHGQEEDSESLGEGGGLQREISLPTSSQEAKEVNVSMLRMCQQILCHLIFSGFGDEKSEGSAGKGTEG